MATTRADDCGDSSGWGQIPAGMVVDGDKCLRKRLGMGTDMCGDGWGQEHHMRGWY